MDKFNSKHLFFIICAVTISSLKTYPEIFINISGRDSWVCIIITALIMLIYFDYLIKIYLNNNYESLQDIFTIALGNFLGKVFLALFAIMLFLTLIESAAIEASVVHINLFIESPSWFILLFIVIPGVYVVVKGKNALMLVLMLSMTVSIFNGINLYILTERYKDYKLLFPIFEKGINFNFFIGIVKSMGLYSSIVISLPYLYLIKKNKVLRKIAFISNLFLAQMIFVAIVGVITTFTVQRANVLVYPTIIQTQLITYYGIIAIGEFYVVFQVLSSWFAKYVTTFFALLIVLKQLNINKIFNLKYLPYCISGLVYLMACSLDNNLLALFEFLNYYDYISIVGFLIIPFIVFTIYGLKHKNKTS